MNQPRIAGSSQPSMLGNSWKGQCRRGGCQRAGGEPDVSGCGRGRAHQDISSTCCLQDQSIYHLCKHVHRNYMILVIVCTHLHENGPIPININNISVGTIISTVWLCLMCKAWMWTIGTTVLLISGYSIVQLAIEQGDCYFFVALPCNVNYMHLHQLLK